MMFLLCSEVSRQVDPSVPTRGVRASSLPLPWPSVGGQPAPHPFRAEPMGAETARAAGADGPCGPLLQCFRSLCAGRQSIGFAASGGAVAGERRSLNTKGRKEGLRPPPMESEGSDAEENAAFEAWDTMEQAHTY